MSLACLRGRTTDSPEHTHTPFPHHPITSIPRSSGAAPCPPRPTATAIFFPSLTAKPGRPGSSVSGGARRAKKGQGASLQAWQPIHPSDHFYLSTYLNPTKTKHHKVHSPHLLFFTLLLSMISATKPSTKLPFLEKTTQRTFTPEPRH